MRIPKFEGECIGGPLDGKREESETGAFLFYGLGAFYDGGQPHRYELRSRDEGLKYVYVGIDRSCGG